MHVSYCDPQSKPFQSDNVEHKGRSIESYAHHIQSRALGTSGQGAVTMSAFNTLVECASNLSPRGPKTKASFTQRTVGSYVKFETFCEFLAMLVGCSVSSELRIH